MARIGAELEHRIALLRPLLDEYERLLEAADALDSFEAAPAAGESEPAPLPVSPRRRARGSRGPRGSAAGTIELAASAPEPPTQALEPEPTPPASRTPLAPRILPAMPSLRTQPGPGVLPSSLSTAPAKATAIAVEAPPAVPERAVEEFEPEPELERKPASPSEVRQAILAALEHGSHTIGEP